MKVAALYASGTWFLFLFLFFFVFIFVFLFFVFLCFLVTNWMVETAIQAIGSRAIARDEFLIYDYITIRSKHGPGLLLDT